MKRSIALTLLAISSLAATIPSTVYAVTSSEAAKVKQNIADLKKNEQCYRCFLVEANLAGYRLNGFILDNSNMTKANLKSAELQEVSFRGTNLENADLQSADLRRAKFIGANLRYADLRDANLEGADFAGANLSGAAVKVENLVKKAYSLNGATMPNGDRYDAKKYQHWLKK